ncbi:prephenate dehydrogenase [Calderihabitans maritimus]|uniref:Prephenate dehydrogenase n=1 Tax=Calderihabitans maritimus TaxID=1246530 RepID=A0A1Z5HUL0_9FIRM|nr:prephenate dehydrogenase [Calderihabitans maritimus]
MTGIFRQAQEIRSSIPRKLKGILPAVYELVVTVPDRPGMIAEIGRLLGDEGINIIDIEILRVREGEGGTIRLGFQTEEAVEEALRILRDNGIIVKRR